jgi:hypothetical protein
VKRPHVITEELSGKQQEQCQKKGRKAGAYKASQQGLPDAGLPKEENKGDRGLPKNEEGAGLHAEGAVARHCEERFGRCEEEDVCVDQNNLPGGQLSISIHHASKAWTYLQYDGRKWAMGRERGG